MIFDIIETPFTENVQYKLGKINDDIVIFWCHSSGNTASIMIKGFILGGFIFQTINMTFFPILIDLM